MTQNENFKYLVYPIVNVSRACTALVIQYKVIWLNTVGTVMENGVINCEDYMRLHQLDASGCTESLGSTYKNKYKLCLRTFQ
ncbi:hypothetical protein DBV15_05475, partial [Temnothorax longispinosus]